MTTKYRVFPLDLLFAPPTASTKPTTLPQAERVGYILFCKIHPWIISINYNVLLENIAQREKQALKGDKESE